MLWQNLSIETKSIIEWIESPISNQRLTLTVEKNKEWFMPCRYWSGDVRVFVTEQIFNEVRDWINYDKYIKVIENGEEKLVFTLVDGVKLH